MAVGQMKLYWKKQCVGVITDATWSEFPSVIGRFELRQVSNRLREVLNWFAAQSEADELKDPPFEAELLENWAIVKSNRSRVELLLPPIIDFDKGLAQWRE